MEETKPITRSQTIISLAAMVASVFLPRYATFIPQVASDAIFIASAVSAAWGRVRAKKRIQSNQ